MFQAIESFVELVDMTKMECVFKTRWLTYTDLLLNFAIKEGTLNIHLIHLDVVVDSKG